MYLYETHLHTYPVSRCAGATVREVLDMDYRALGRRILHEFKEYIEKTNEEALKQAENREKRKSPPR